MAKNGKPVSIEKMILKNYMTVSELSKKLECTRQRVHQLIKTYGVETEVFEQRIYIPISELRKIPEERPTGLHVK